MRAGKPMILKSVKLPRPGTPLMAGLLLIVLLAFGLRIYDLASLTLYGDYAYSVYAARQDLATIARERVLDGHPPLFYYLLHFWILGVGQTELTIRMLSVLFGVLMVPLTYSLGTRLQGRRVGLLGSLLVAVSPALVHYSRLPRMYILLALLALLSAYTLSRALENDRRRDWAVYSLATALLIYTHYYGLALVVAEVSYVVLVHRRPDRPATRFVAPMAWLVIVYLPWLWFAAATSATVTARIISNAPWPTDFQGVLEQFWIPFNVGDFLEIGIARLLASTVLVLWIVVLWLERQYLHRRWRDLRLLVFAVGVPVGAALSLFVVMPYAVRPRFLIFCIPLYLLLLATALCGKRWWLTSAGVAIVVVSSGYALMEAYGVEPNVVEYDAIGLTEHIEKVAQPEDAVIFQAFWQIGYFTTHYRGSAPAAYNMRDLPAKNLEAILGNHPKVWLAMFRVPVRNPEYPLEEWLDRNWHRAEEVEIGETRVISYVRPKLDGWRDVDFEFEAAERTPILRLASVQLEGTDLKPGDRVAVGLRWLALRSISERYTVFLQLVDSSGERWAGTDREPVAGTEPTAGWGEDRVVEDRLAIALPVAIPPGDYTLRVGAYPTGEPRPLAALGPDGSIYNQGVTIGRVRVRSYPREELQMRHPLDHRLGDSIALLGYDLDIDSYQVGVTREVTALTDNPIQLVFPKRSYQASDTVEITLYWQALRPVDQDYTVFVHLVDSGGQVKAQVDRKPVKGHYATSRWNPGEVVVDKYHLGIDPTTPPGEYELRIGMYLPSTLERVPTRGTTGTADHVELQRVRIDPALPR